MLCVSWTNNVSNWIYKGLLFVAAIFLGRDNFRLNLTLKTVFSKLKVKVSAESGSYTIIHLQLDKASIAEYVLSFSDLIETIHWNHLYLYIVFNRFTLVFLHNTFYNYFVERYISKNFAEQ